MILITGSEGFLGTYLSKRFDIKKIRYKKIFYDKELSVTDNFCKLDLSQAQQVLDLGDKIEPPEIVIHLAGFIDINFERNYFNKFLPPCIGKENFRKIYLSNVVATQNIVNFCIKYKVRHLIYASTQAVYGMPFDVSLTEESSCYPLEHYAASKLWGERLCEMGAQYGLNVSILRFPGIYSENRKSGAIYNFCKSALFNNIINVDADIPIPFDVIYLDDVLNAIEEIIKLKNKRILKLNISTGEPCSLNLLADSIAELVLKCKVNYSKIDQPIVVMDSSKAQRILKWKPLMRKFRLKKYLKSFDYDYTFRADIEGSRETATHF